MKRCSELARLLVLSLVVARGASARVPTRRSAPRAEPAPALSDVTLRKRLGIEVAGNLLRSQDPEQRKRGFERLDSVGTAQALDLLMKAFDAGGAARSASDRLVAVRALSSHARVPAVREFLVRVLVGVGSNPGHPEAIDGLIEHAAALSLAESGDDAALLALGKALRQSGHVADTAEDALLAFPPRNLEPIVQGLRSPTRTLARLLGELGDRRAIAALREIVQSGPLDVRPEAAVGLSELGVTDTIELARYWLKHEHEQDFHVAAARILLAFQTPDASSAVAHLLEDEHGRALGLELASQASLPALSAALIRGATSASASEQSAWFAALARTGSRAAFSFFGGALGARETSSAAALALALSPAQPAEDTIELGLQNPRTRRAAVRASLVRKVALGRTPAGLASALRELGASRDASDRAVFVQASAVFSSSSVAELLKSATPSEVRALSRAALLPEVSSALAERLSSEPDPGLREALAACLVSPSAADRVPSDVLMALLDRGGLAAPLALRALGARDSRTLRPRLLAGLASDDPLHRSHAALGLGQSREGSAVGVLTLAYRFETDAHVRLAIVRALAARREPSRFSTLRLARRLDGTSEVREAAILALTGAQPTGQDQGPQTAWLELLLTPNTDEEPSLVRGAAVLTAGGLAVPVFADPDGVLLLSALPAGPFELRLAAPARTDNAVVPRYP